MKNFSEGLKYAMAQADMSQSALSEKSGCSKAAISQYLSGKNTPGPAKVKALADALGVSVEYLMGFDVPPVKEPAPSIINRRIENDKKRKKEIERKSRGHRKH